MATGYDGKPIVGYMGVYSALTEKYKASDPDVTKDTFVQLVKDLEDFREKHASLGFGKKAPVEGPSQSLGFPDIAKPEAQALLSKIKMSILND